MIDPSAYGLTEKDAERLDSLSYNEKRYLQDKHEREITLEYIEQAMTNGWEEFQEEELMDAVAEDDYEAIADIFEQEMGEYAIPPTDYEDVMSVVYDSILRYAKEKTGRK